MPLNANGSDESESPLRGAAGGVPQQNEGQEAQGRSQVDLVVTHAGRAERRPQRKRAGGENGDRERKGGDRSQQQAAGRAAYVEDKRKAGRAGDVEDKCKAGREGGRTGGRAGDVEDKRKAQREGGESSGLSRTAAARRRHGHDDDAFICPTSCIPGHATVRDRIDRAKGMTVRQAIQLTIYTTRSLKRDETAGDIRLVRATAQGDPDAVMRDAEIDGLERDRSPMDSDTYGSHPVDDFQTEPNGLAQQTVG